jgi:hypothetical protein
VAELIPQSAAAIVANLATTQVWTMLILAPVFVVLVNRLNRFWRCQGFKVHWNTPIIFNDTLMTKSMAMYSSILLSFYSVNGAD